MSHKFETSEELGRRLRCPRCKELLLPADLETYSRCPYCETAIPNDAELEDFVIEPMVRQWVDRYKH